jgi:hypothetical protein
MTKARPAAPADPRITVKEFFTATTLPALNRVLLNRGIDPHAIITIVEMHGQTLASRTSPQFGVLYEVVSCGRDIARTA